MAMCVRGVLGLRLCYCEGAVIQGLLEWIICVRIWPLLCGNVEMCIV